MTKLFHNRKISKGQHRKFLPFLEFKHEDVDELSLECENIISSNSVTNLTYSCDFFYVENISIQMIY